MGQAPLRSQRRDLPLVRAVLALGVRAAVCADRGAPCRADAPCDLAACGMDRRRHGRGAQRGDGIQPAGRRAPRRAQPANRDAGAAARRHVAHRSDGVRRALLGRLCVCVVAVEHVVRGALAARARDRVLVFARQTLHDLHAGVSWPCDGRGAGRRLARRRWSGRMGAVAARRRDRIMGGRLRRALRVPGSRLRSRTRPAFDPGAIRRTAIAPHLARDACRRRRCACSRSV